MFLVLVALFLLLPIAELWVTIQVASSIGALATVALLVLMSVSGVVLLRRQGASVWRAANQEMAAGRVPTKQLLDGALVVVGGVCLVVPGFITGVFGALLMLPPVRALLRPVLLAWMTARAARAARSGRMQAVFMTSTTAADGSVSTRVRDTDVIDTDGWDVGADPDELGRGGEPGGERGGDGPGSPR